MSERVERRGDSIPLVVADACAFCGDELVRGKCARRCDASRRAVVKDAKRVERHG